VCNTQKSLCVLMCVCECLGNVCINVSIHAQVQGLNICKHTCSYVYMKIMNMLLKTKLFCYFFSLSHSFLMVAHCDNFWPCLLSDKWDPQLIRCKQKYKTSPNWKRTSWQKDLIQDWVKIWYNEWFISYFL